MTVLFIGGTGNISADCAALLHGRGHEILVLSRGKNRIPKDYRPIQADRKSPDAMRSALKGTKPDVVINFLGYEISDVEADFALFNGSVRQYIFISSATVYEKPPRKIPVTEDAPLENRWWDYAQKKIACEHWLQQRAKEFGFPITIVRPSHTYSRLWVPNAISSSSYTFASRLEQGKPVFVHDDGETPWTLTAASDFAVGLAGLVGNEKAISEAFHITGDEVLTWKQIYAEIAEAGGAKSPQIVKIPTDFICKMAPDLTGNLKGDKAHPGVFDNSKIKRFVPEFQTRKPFRVGIRESVSWLRAHPDQQNLTPKVDETIDTVIAGWRSRK
jgi:nucleoside-diphosphate-sugar epimerase